MLKHFPKKDAWRPAAREPHWDREPPGTPGDLDAAFDLAFYAPIQQFRGAADTKAGALITASGIMFTLLARYSEHVVVLTRSPGPQRLLLLLLLAVFVGLSLKAIIHAFRTISPRFKEGPPSLAFFADIARLPREEFIARVEGLSREEALEQMLNYNHTLSLIIEEKFTELGRAIFFFEWAFLCWLALAVTAAVKVVLQ